MAGTPSAVIMLKAEHNKAVRLSLDNSSASNSSVTPSSQAGSHSQHSDRVGTGEGVRQLHAVKPQLDAPPPRSDLILKGPQLHTKVGTPHNSPADAAIVHLWRLVLAAAQ